jgi:hypothetical protein
MSPFHWVILVCCVVGLAFILNECGSEKEDERHALRRARAKRRSTYLVSDPDKARRYRSEELRKRIECGTVRRHRSYLKVW